MNGMVPSKRGLHPMSKAVFPTGLTHPRRGLPAGEAMPTSASGSNACDGAGAGASVAKRLRSAVLLASAALIGLSPCSSHAQAPGPALAAQLKEHVVLVGTGRGTGSGVILGVKRVVTNCHVVDVATAGDTSVQVVTHAGADPLPASLIARDAAHDLCLLAIDEPNRLQEKWLAPIASSPVEEGSPVYAAGAPGGHIDSVTSGIVSNLDDQRNFPVDEQVKMLRHFELCRAAELDSAWYIQTDALFSKGSSGGGLFNANGELVGITTFGDPVPDDRDDRYTIRFAVPAVYVQTLVDEDPDRALRNVVKHFAETDEFERAIATIGRIRSTEDRVRAWVDVARAELSKGRKSSAIGKLMEAEKTARTIEDPKRRAWRLNRVAGAFVDAGEFREASRIAAGITVLDVQARAYRTVAMEQAKQNHFADARRTVRQIRDLSTRARTSDFVLGEEIKALMAADNPDRAREVANGIRKTSTRAYALQRIARAYGKLRDVQAALRTYAEAIGLADQIPDPSRRAEALMQIAGSLAREDFTTDARTTVDAAIRAAGRIGEDAARDEAFRDIVDRLSNMEGFTSTQIRVAGRIGDSRERDSATNSIVTTLAERGEFDAARKWARTIDHPTIRGAAQRRIVVELLDRKAWVEAREFAKGIAHKPSRARAFQDIVWERGDSASSRELGRLADLIEDPITRTEAYLFITEEALYADRVNQARVHELLTTTEDLAGEIPDPDERASQVMDLAALYVAAGEDEKALELLVPLVSTRHYARGLRHLAEAYADRGDFPTAEKLIDHIPHCAQDERERARKHLEKRR